MECLWGKLLREDLLKQLASEVELPMCRFWVKLSLRREAINRTAIINGDNLSSYLDAKTLPGDTVVAPDPPSVMASGH
jgi:hypothetical protein